MQKQKRWIKSLIETANADTTAMPWQRGSRRNTYIVKRRATLPLAKSA